jgi:hypothetical protein
MFWLACPGCRVLTVLSWLSCSFSCPSCPVPVVFVLSCWYCPSRLVPAVISWLSCPLSYSVVLSQMSSPRYPVPTVLSWMSCHSCIVRVIKLRCAVLYLMFCPHFPFQADLSIRPPPFPAAPSCPVPAVLHQHSCPQLFSPRAVPSLQSCPGHPALYRITCQPTCLGFPFPAVLSLLL